MNVELQLDLFNMAPNNSGEVVDILQQHGFNNFKPVKGNFIYVLTPWNQRNQAMDYMVQNIPGAWYDRTVSGSSLGAVRLGNFKIQVKPDCSQGAQSSGVANELYLKEMMDQFITSGPINVTFTGLNKSVVFKNVSSVEHVGSKQKDRKNHKADLLLHGDKTYPISIKKDNSEFWAKAESFYGEKARKILDGCLANSTVKMQQVDHYYKLMTEVAFQPSIADKKYLVFGDDNANIVKRTFTYQDFSFNKKTNMLNITSSRILTNIADLDKDHDVFYILRNDKSRNSSTIGLRGLTLESVMSSRISSSKNLVIVPNPFKN
jgi:hypothetical protein